MKPNYFTIHKNKNPKKLKYSKPYTKLEKENIEELMEFFKNKVMHVSEKAKVVFLAVDKISYSLTNIFDSMKKIKTP